MDNASKRLRLNFNKKKGICDDLLPSKSQCQTTENNVGAEGHKWQVKVRSIDIMARWLIFQAPSYLLCNPCPMTLMKEWKENHFELVLNILVIYLEIILHIMSCKIPAYIALNIILAVAKICTKNARACSI
jgi:hypothetical protein